MTALRSIRHRDDHAPEDGPLSIQDVALLCQNEPGPVPWLYPGILSEGGYTLLYGRPKMGKSTLAYQIATALATGQDFLGHAVKPRRVLWLNMDTPLNTLHRGMSRCAAASIAPGQLFHYTTGLAPSLERVLATIDKYDIGVLVVDTLKKWRGVKDDNSYAEVSAAMAPVLHALRFREVTLLGLTHARKSGGEVGESAGGSVAWMGDADNAVEMVLEDGLSDSRRRLRFISRVELLPDAVVRLEDWRYTRAEPAAATATANKEREVMERLMDGGLTSEAMATLIQQSERHVRARLNALAERGSLTRSGSGRKGDPVIFALSDSGFLEIAGNNRKTEIP